MTEFRVKAYHAWKEMEEPEWFNATYDSPDFDNIQYYSSPKDKPKNESLDDVDPKIRKLTRSWEYPGRAKNAVRRCRRCCIR